MLHMPTLIHPEQLKGIGQKILQNQNEIVMLFSHIYHQGINLGANLCMAQSIATDKWAETVTEAKCKCHGALSEKNCREIRKNYQRMIGSRE